MVSVVMSTQTIVGCATDVERAACNTLSDLDSGLFKTVYVDEQYSTVYKIVKSVHGYGSDVRRAATGQLICEAERAIELQANGLRGIPNVTLYSTDDGQHVLAMPYFPKPGYDAELHPDFDDIFRAWEDNGIDDLHGGNYAADADGNPYVIDLAGWAHGYTDESALEYGTEIYCEQCDDYHGTPCPTPDYETETETEETDKRTGCPCHGNVGGALSRHERHEHRYCAFGPKPATVRPTLWERLPHTVMRQRPLWPLFAFVIRP